MTLLGIVAGKLSVLITSAIWLFSVWFGVILLLKFISKLDHKIDFGTFGKIAFMEDRMSRSTLSVDLEKAATQIVEMIRRPNDSYSDTYKAFAVLVDALSLGEALPAYYNNIVVDKMLYEYHRKYGDITCHFLRSKALTVQEIMRPLDAAETHTFIQWCIDCSRR